ncbi:TonB-dependent receptor [Tamlana fucoidanivorans]|uniref:TonB-dependent receptor n=1 Tax=Allotamlana fucoidanivorans TaxID=2583814 RepID=A0A5C4SN82_9FLAO|nr:outer membrane beta-barrel family protein [Tamlana fucoidanivorans]TNJ45258.1 TonB-dependent receptor [Tamlana fucoidanivorans]
MIKNVICLFFLCFVGIGISNAQRGSVSGNIIDDETNVPLEYATIALYSNKDKSLTTGVISQEDGRFNIDNIKRGSYYLQLSFMGYDTKTINNIEITNKNLDINLGTIKLALNSDELDEVLVKSKRNTVVNKIDRQVYNSNAFQNTKGGSATDIIKNLPSVSVNSLGEISVRGSQGFVLLIDGKPIQGEASVFLNQIPANAIERVEMITAPSAKYDPEGKAGILNIISKKGALNGNFAQINISAGLPSIEDYDNKEAAQRYGFDGIYNIRKELWNISLGANYQRKDISGRREGYVYTIVDDVFTEFPSDGERSFDEENYSGRFTVDYTPNDNNAFSFGFYAGKREKARTADILYHNQAYPVDDEDNKIFELTYFNENLRIRKGDFILGSFDYAHTFKNESKLSSSILYEYTQLGAPTTNKNLNYPDTENVIQDEYNTNDNPLNGFRGQLDYVLKPFDFGTLQTGYQFRTLNNRGDFFYGRRYDYNDDFERVDLFSSDIKLKRNIHSVYGQLDGSDDNWEYSAGLRLELLDRELFLADKAGTTEEELNYSYEKLFPSATLKYNFTEKSSLKASYSKRVERPSAFKLNPFREREHSETLEQGDKTLLPEFIDLVEVGFTKKFKESSSFFITGYFRNVQNLVNRVNKIYDGPPIDPNDPRFDNVVLDRIYSNVGTGRSLGVDLGTNINVGDNWNNFLGANVYHYTIDGAYNGKKIDTKATQFSINANSTYDLSDTASLQFTFNYLSERKTAQGEDARFYSPNLSFKKSFLDNQLVLTAQWQNIDMGLLSTNEQRITTWEPGEFFTTTNYVYEVDVVMLNLSYTFKNTKNKSKFIDSEFGKKEF